MTSMFTRAYLLSDASSLQFLCTLKVVPNAKKFRYCGIDPELEDKLDQMFLGVVATGDHAWTPNEGMNNENITEDSKNIDIGSDSFEDPSKNLESISDCGQLKRPISTTSTGRRKKIFGSTFLRSQITQLVNSCTNMTSETNASKTNITSETSSISAAIKVLEQTTEVFEDMQLYLFSTKLLEDPTKREVFMSISPDRREYLNLIIAIVSVTESRGASICRGPESILNWRMSQHHLTLDVYLGDLESTTDQAINSTEHKMGKRPQIKGAIGPSGYFSPASKKKKNQDIFFGSSVKDQSIHSPVQYPNVLHSLYSLFTCLLVFNVDQ
ncbi:hypothetical protein M5K25_016380 [Dendrobium thyrsiflorum]|uniref:Uncharacterized protein n=1 Tax=Dendrobium thyrsiflorum TaxID=117978 RepID=A0ABD0URM1_DENTH